MVRQPLYNLLHNKPKIRQSFARYVIPSLSTTFRLASTSRKWYLGHFIKITFERKEQTVVRSRYVSSVERMPANKRQQFVTSVHWPLDAGRHLSASPNDCTLMIICYPGQNIAAAFRLSRPADRRYESIRFSGENRREYCLSSGP